jgi:DNA-binding IclR family transcriptional regulator
LLRAYTEDAGILFDRIESLVAKPLKTPPPYAIASVDHALQLAVILQVEGGLTVSDAAERLGVARSTAHRLLAMLVYRDYAWQDEDRVYRAGRVLEVAAHSQAQTSALRTAALPHLQRVVELTRETANLIIRIGDTVRFIASVESREAVRVGSREGMVFPAHLTTAGLLLLAELSDAELNSVYAQERYANRPRERPDLVPLRADLARIRRTGFVVNRERSERSLVAVGVPVRGRTGAALAGLAVAMPAVRYDQRQMESLLSDLSSAAAAVGVAAGRPLAHPRPRAVRPTATGVSVLRARRRGADAD